MSFTMYYPWEYNSIPWDYIDQQWWCFPVEIVIIIYCFIGFHVTSSEHLLPSLDAFCRKWNISLRTAQPTIYALGAVAPIIILSNVAFASDILQQTQEAHKLGIASIIGFGLTTACFVPACAVFSLHSRIVLPKNSIIRDHIFIIVLLSIFFVIIVTGRVHWWQSAIVGTIYIVYLFSVILYPKIKTLFQSPHKMQRNRLLSQLEQSQHHAHFPHFPKTSSTDQSYQKFETEEAPAVMPSFDSTRFLSDLLPIHMPLPTATDTPTIGTEYNQFSNYSQYSASPDRKSVASGRSSIASLRHPMLLNEYDPDFALFDDEFQIKENDNESMSVVTEENVNKHNKIVLTTPENQKGVYHIYPTIQFQSLNEQGSNSGAEATQSKIYNGGTFNGCFDTLCSFYYYAAFPLQVLLKLTIPATKIHSKCECLYPISLIISCIWITLFSFVLIAIIYHYSIMYSWSLAIIGVVYIGPIAAFPNIVDCVTLSLQGFATEITINSYHIQMSNLFFGIIIPLLVSSVINAINAYQHYIKEAILLYWAVLILQAVVLFTPLLCTSVDIQLTRPKGWFYAFVYVVGLSVFYYVAVIEPLVHINF